MSFLKGIYLSISDFVDQTSNFPLWPHIISRNVFFFPVYEQVVEIHKNNSHVCNDHRPGIQEKSICDKKETANTVDISQGGNISHKERQQHEK